MLKPFLLSTSAVLTLSYAAAAPQEPNEGARSAVHADAVALDAPRAAMLWHALVGEEMPDAEVLGMLKVDPGAYNEFERRRIVAQNRERMALAENRPSTAAVYSLSTRAVLGEYDFTLRAFPVNMAPERDPLRITVGRQDFASDACGGGVMKTSYGVSVNLPADTYRVAMDEAEAEKLMPRFGKAPRTVEISLLIKPTSDADEQPPDDDSCESERVIEAEPIGIDIALPPKTMPDSKVLPRKLIYSWRAADTANDGGARVSASSSPTPP